MTKAADFGSAAKNAMDALISTRRLRCHLYRATFIYKSSSGRIRGFLRSVVGFFEIIEASAWSFKGTTILSRVNDTTQPAPVLTVPAGPVRRFVVDI